MMKREVLKKLMDAFDGFESTKAFSELLLDKSGPAEIHLGISFDKLEELPQADIDQRGDCKEYYTSFTSWTFEKICILWEGIVAREVNHERDLFLWSDSKRMPLSPIFAECVAAEESLARGEGLPHLVEGPYILIGPDTDPSELLSIK